MTLQELNELIDEAIEKSKENPAAMPQTNALNAEYCLGTIHAYIDIIWKQYGIDAFFEAVDRTGSTVKELMERTQIVY